MQSLPARLRISAQHTYPAASLPIFSVHQRPIKPQTVSCEIDLRLFSFIYDFRAALEPGTAYCRLCQSDAGRTIPTRKEGPTMSVHRNHTHPRSERHGVYWVPVLLNALSKRSPRHGFSGRFGDSSSRRSRSVPRQLVRASSGAGRTQRKHFAVGESRQELSAAGVPAGLGGSMRNATQHGETEYFRYIFTLFPLRDIFD